MLHKGKVTTINVSMQEIEARKQLFEDAHTDVKVSKGTRRKNEILSKISLEK